MDGAALDPFATDDDSTPLAGADLPEDRLDASIGIELFDASDDLADIFAVRHRIERSPERLD